MLTQIGIFISIGMVLWLAGAVVHRFSSHNLISVHPWLARLGGSQSGSIDPKGFSIQLFGLGLTLWYSFLIFVFPPGQHRGALGQLGFTVLLIIAMVMSFLLPRLIKK